MDTKTKIINEESILHESYLSHHDIPLEIRIKFKSLLLLLDELQQGKKKLEETFSEYKQIRSLQRSTSLFLGELKHIEVSQKEQVPIIQELLDTVLKIQKKLPTLIEEKLFDHAYETEFKEKISLTLMFPEAKSLGVPDKCIQILEQNNYYEQQAIQKIKQSKVMSMEFKDTIEDVMETADVSERLRLIGEEMNWLYLPGAARVRMKHLLQKKYKSSTDIDEIENLFISALIISVPRFYSLGLSIKENMRLCRAFEEKRAKEVVGIIISAQQQYEQRNKLSERVDTLSQYFSTVEFENGSQKIVDIVPINEEKKRMRDPLSNEECELTRSELHERIIKKFLDHVEPQENPFMKILGGLPGAGKSYTLSQITKDQTFVIVNPDEVKEYLPEYKREDGTFDDYIVHEESSILSKKIQRIAVSKKYNIVIDSTMNDDPRKGFKKYKDIISNAKKDNYTVTVDFVFDNGAGWYRNSVLRPRATRPGIYLDYLPAFDTMDFLVDSFKNGKSDMVSRATIWSNTKEVEGQNKQLALYSNEDYPTQVAFNTPFVQEQFKLYRAFEGEMQALTKKKEKKYLSEYNEKLNFALSSLEVRLMAANIDFSKWGKNGTKTILDLLEEEESGKCILHEVTHADGERKLERYLEVAVVDIMYEDASGKKYKLVEKKQNIQPDIHNHFEQGYERKRSLLGSFSEKVRSGKQERGEDALRKGMKAMGIEGALHFQKENVVYRESNSESYPGIVTKYNLTKYTSYLTPEQFKPDGYFEKQEGVTSEFGWEEI